MGRLIDADRLKGHYSWWGEDDERKKTFDCIVDQQPTVDAVVVNRCKDCRYYGQKYHRCGIFGCDKEPEGFCDEWMRRPTE